MPNDTSKPAPLLKRIKINTIGAADLASVEDWYGEWLGYRVCEQGEIGPALAYSWGTPNMADRPYILMEPESGADVFIRVAQITAVPDYKPMTTLGWNSFEIIVDDVYALNDKLAKSPFEIIGPPQSLGGDLERIHAMQVIGPAQDVLYLTCDTGDRDDSLLPKPGASVGRPFIAVLAGNGTGPIQDYYTDHFGMQREGDFDTAIGVIARAQGKPEDHIFPMGFMAMADHGNFIEFDGYEAGYGARPRADGELPPGCASVSVTVESLDSFKLNYQGEAVSDDSRAYGGGRSRTAIGAAGELLELIETA